MSYQQTADSGAPLRGRIADTVSNVIDDVIKLQRRITSRAADYAHDGNIDRAIETLEVGLDQYPDNIYFLGQLGQLYRRAGYMEDARQCLERSFELKPSDIRTVTSLAGVYVELGLDAQAEAMLAKARQLDRNDKFVIVSLAKLMSEQGRYEEAADLLKSSGGLEQGNKFIMASYGVVQALLGNADVARDVLERGYTLHSRDPYIINLLGSIRAEMGDYAAAEDVLIAGSRIDPHNRHICASLASVYSRQKKYDEAERALLAGRRFNARDTVLINSLGNVYAHIGQFERAEETLLEGRKYDPANLAIVTTLGHTYLKTAEYGRYEALIEQTQDNGVDDDSYQYLIAKGALLQGKQSQALAACRRLIEMRGVDAQSAILYIACAEDGDAMLGSFAVEFGTEAFEDLKSRAADIRDNPRLIDLYDPKFLTSDLSQFVIQPRDTRPNERRVVRAASLLIAALVVGATGLHFSGVPVESMAAADLTGAPMNVWMTIVLALCCCTPDVPQARRISWALRR